VFPHAGLLIRERLSLTNPHKVVLLVGGVGGAKLAYGLAQVIDADNLTIIVNTGDDFWHYGLRICPDLDTVMYTLSGLVDKTNGWGVREDTAHMLDALRRYGESPWFRLGDQDLATHLLRSQWLRDGVSMTEITARLTSSLHISCTLLPMTDSPVATIVNTKEHGELPFQEYFVRHRWQPTVESLRLDGIESAALSDEVQQAITTAEMVVIGPSNPWLSIDPILNVPGMRDLIKAAGAPCVAVTPIVDGKALKGPAAKLMREWGLRVTAETVAQHYGDILDGFVYDQTDTDFNYDLVDMPHCVQMDTVMDSDEKRVMLAQQIIHWMEATLL
jgi:LPPG:FO 2-phospho-L-lactate transferase